MYMVTYEDERMYKRVIFSHVDAIISLVYTM